MSHRADVLIVTVTTVEGRAVTDVFGKANKVAPKVIPIGDLHYRDLGRIKGSRVYMAITEMGSGGRGGSQEAVRKGIEALKPYAVIMVGIAFGTNEEKQNIGDILVSKQLLPYELQRIGKFETTQRSDKPHASPSLINWISHAVLDWNEDEGRITQGLILSGDKLVDNVDYRNQLTQFAPEAIGGEMEGAGLYVACENNKTEWILIKAICDFADGNKGKNKEEQQRLAAHNAASFVLHALQMAPLTRDGGKVPQPIHGLHAGQIHNFRQSYLVSETRVLSFGGREAELKLLTEWLSEKNGPGRLLITGPSGRGKSALLVQWTEAIDRSSAEDAWNIVFVPISMRFGTSRPSIFYSMLASQLAAILERPIQPPLSDPEEFYIDAASSMLQQLASSSTKVLVVVDGIDEALDQRFNATIFPINLPPTMRVVLSAREQANDAGSTGWMQRLEWSKAVRTKPMELSILDKPDAWDVLKSAGLTPTEMSDEVVDRILFLSEGEPLVLKLYAEDLAKIAKAKGVIGTDDLRGLTPGFGAYFFKWLERQRRAWKDEESTIDEPIVDGTLAVLACAYGPLQSEHLVSLACKITGRDQPFSAQYFTEPIKRFIVGRGTHDSGYVLSHPKLGQYLREEYFQPKIIASIHSEFANWGRATVISLNQENNASCEAPPYLLQFYTQHLDSSLGAVDDYASLLSNGWRLAWEKYEGGYSGFTENIRAILNRLGTSEQYLPNIANILRIRFRAALCLSSVQSIGSNCPRELLALALDEGLLTLRQVEHYIELQLPENRCEYRMAILKHIPKQADEVIDEIHKTSNDENRIQFLIQILGDIHEEKRKLLIVNILDRIWKIESPYRRACFMVDMVPYRDREYLSTIFIEIKAIKKTAPDTPSFALTFGRLFEYFTKAEDSQSASEALSYCLSIIDKHAGLYEKIADISALANTLPNDAIHLWVRALLPFVDEQFNMARISGSATFHDMALQNALRCKTQLMLLYARQIPDSEYGQKLNGIFENANVVDIYDRVRIITNSLPLIREDFKPKVLQDCFEMTRQLQTGNNRTHAMMALAKEAPLPLRTDIIREGVINSRLIEDEYSRCLALVKLFAQLPQDEKLIEYPQLVAEINQIYYVLRRGELFIELAPHVPELGQELSGVGVRLISMASDLHFRVNGLVIHFEKLPSPLRVSVFHQCFEQLLQMEKEPFTGFEIGLLLSKAPDLCSKDILEAAYILSRKISNDWSKVSLLVSLISLAVQFNRSYIIAETFLVVFVSQNNESRTHALNSMASSIKNASDQQEVIREAWVQAMHINPSIADKMIEMLPIISGSTQEALWLVVKDSLSPEQAKKFEPVATASAISSLTTIPEHIPSKSEQLQELDTLTQRSGVTRSTLLADLGKAAPTFNSIGGAALVRQVMHEIYEIARWWP